MSVHCPFFVFYNAWFSWSMFVHIRQPVREQPDTGYRKSLLFYFAPAPVYLGGELYFTFDDVGGLCSTLEERIAGEWMNIGF